MGSVVTPPSPGIQWKARVVGPCRIARTCIRGGRRSEWRNGKGRGGTIRACHKQMALRPRRCGEGAGRKVLLLFVDHVIVIVVVIVIPQVILIVVAQVVVIVMAIDMAREK